MKNFEENLENRCFYLKLIQNHHLMLLMKNILYPILVGLFLFYGTSCKTYRNVENFGSGTDRNALADDLPKLKSGEKIRIKDKNGKTIDMEFFYNTETEITGVDNAGVPIAVNIADVSQLRAKRVNWVMTGIVLPIAILVTTLGIVVNSWGAG